MKIVIFGPQGSGKGTQAEVLSKRLKIPQITMGDLLREEIKNHSQVGKEIDAIVNRGQLVPDEVSTQILKQRLLKADCQNGFVLDGYPRNLNQAKLLAEITKVDKALEIWISDKEAVKRISGRRSCPRCGAVYHLQFNPPKIDELCDQCQTKLIVRDDDKEEIIKNRLAIYHQATEPIIKYYQQSGVHLKIDGLPPIAEVTEDVFGKLKI